jgi:hypothetical protein
MHLPRMTEIEDDTQLYRKVLVSQMAMHEAKDKADVLLLASTLKASSSRMVTPWSHPGPDMP